MKNPIILKTIGIIALIVAGVIFAFITNQHPHFVKKWLNKKDAAQNSSQLKTGTYLASARPLSAFSLQQTDGKPFNNDTLKRKWTFLFFGFTHCSHICPTTMATLKRVAEQLKQQPRALKPSFVFVSVDPKRDDLKTIKRYVKSFNPHFLGVTGTPGQLKNLSQQIGIYFAQVKGENNKSIVNYNIDHSGTIVLINPQGALQALFSSPQNAKAIANDYKKIIQRY